MKNTIHMLLLSMVLMVGISGCSSYYYSVLDSNDQTGILNHDNDFITENDSVYVAYCFYGEDAPVGITIYNKLNEPLWVDWSRSALIIEGVANSYSDNNTQIEGVTESVVSESGYTHRFNRTSSDWKGGFEANIKQPTHVSFIPPRSKIESTPCCLAGFPFKEIPNEIYQTAIVSLADESKVKVKLKKFSEEDSPLRFRSYLTLYTVDVEGKPKHYFAMQRNFYIAQLIKTGNIPPKRWDAGLRKAGNFFYVRNVKGVNAGIVAGAVAAGVGEAVFELTF